MSILDDDREDDGDDDDDEDDGDHGDGDDADDDDEEDDDADLQVSRSDAWGVARSDAPDVSRSDAYVYKSGLAFLLTWPRISLLRVCYRLLFSNLPILQLISDSASEFLAFLLARSKLSAQRFKSWDVSDSDYQRNTIGLQQFWQFGFSYVRTI